MLMARFLKQSLPKLALKKRTMVNCINSIIEMSPRFLLGRENVPCIAEVVNRSLKADCTDFTPYSDAYELIFIQTNYFSGVSIQRNKTL